VDNLEGIVDVLRGVPFRPRCEDALLMLVECATDEQEQDSASSKAPAGPVINSISTSNGCCLKKCAANIKRVSSGHACRHAAGRGCYRKGRSAIWGPHSRGRGAQTRGRARPWHMHAPPAVSYRFGVHVRPRLLPHPGRQHGLL
jgi:hypothetical protein